MENVKKVFKWVVLLLVFIVVVLVLVPKYEPKYNVKNEPIDTNSTEYKEQYAIAKAKHEKSMAKEHLGDSEKRAKAQRVQHAKASKALVSVESHLKVNSRHLVTVDFSIDNKSQGVVTDLEVKCSHYSPTSALLGTNKKVLYVKVEKLSVKKVSGFVMGRVDPQATKGSCKVLSYMFDGVRVWY